MSGAKAKRTYSLRVRNSPLKDLELQHSRTGNSVAVQHRKNHSHLDMLVEEKSAGPLPLPNGDLLKKSNSRGLGRTFSFQSKVKFPPTTTNNNNSDTDSIGSGLVAKNFLRQMLSNSSGKQLENVDSAEDSHGDIGYAKYPKDKEKSRPPGGSVSTVTSWRSQNSTDSSSPTAPLPPDSNLRNGPYLQLDYGTTATTPRLLRFATSTTASLREPLRQQQLIVPKSAMSRSANNLENSKDNEDNKADRKIKFDTDEESDTQRHKVACRSVSDTRKDLKSDEAELAEVHQLNNGNSDKTDRFDSTQVVLETSKDGVKSSLVKPPREPLKTSIYHYTKRLGSSRRYCRRLVQKNGECNISHVNVPKQHSKFIRDIFTTIIDAKWRWSLALFSTAFMMSWLIFAFIYFLICFAHGDLETENRSNPDYIPCLKEVKSFGSAFLFSIETQHTIGYGYRYITDECPTAMCLMCVQSIFGIMVQSFMTGFIFAKLARPKKRAETLIFSKNAVVCMRDGRLCFLFRVGDMRKSHIVECHIRLQVIKKRLTKEGELLPFNQFDMNVGYDEGLDRIFLVWPITICHVIDEDSPLYEYSAEDLVSGGFEIIAIMEGIVESTGMTTQARTSYLPSEIIWGHRLEKLVTYQRDNGEYRVDFNRFHNTYPVDTPRCSAKELDELTEAGVIVEPITFNDTDENDYDDYPSPISSALNKTVSALFSPSLVPTGIITHFQPTPTGTDEMSNDSEETRMTQVSTANVNFSNSSSPAEKRDFHLNVTPPAIIVRSSSSGSISSRKDSAKVLRSAEIM